MSVSHCRGLAVLAIDCRGGAIGVDAESCGRGVQLSRVKARFLSDGQSAWGTSEALLLRGWTIKEAVYKFAGVVGLPLCDVPLPDVGFAADEWPAAEPAWVDVPGGRCAQLRKIALPAFAGCITLASEKV